MNFLKIVFVIFALYLQTFGDDEDFYKLLAVPRDATIKEIRRAFKTLAVKLHPDKNKDDQDADQKFIKIARAYEILKDPDTRKHYDVHGDTGDDKKKSYHSYAYYRDQFGIYDDDPLIVTLSRADYEVNILDDTQPWFVNFYSPNCHHCHELAPTWRKLAAELEGVIRIGAVNCEDDWALCYQLSIESYPTLLYYEKEAHLYEGEHYRGSRTFDTLKEFILEKLPVTVQEVTPDYWENAQSQKWLLFLCANSFNCPEYETRLKMAAILDGLMFVGLVSDEQLCEKILKPHEKNPIVFVEPIESQTVHIIDGSDSKDILNNVLNLLPNPPVINNDDFKEIRSKLKSSNDENPWLLCFYIGAATDLNLQLKRLPSLIPSINIGLIHCGQSSSLCSSLHISRYPTWGVIKVGGAVELHHGRDVLYEVSGFARDSVRSTNLHALSPADFTSILTQDSAWFIDWYAPWCPPCRKLMPELRRASQHFNPEQVQFGTIDCTLHRGLCSQNNIASYPTTMLYNRTERVSFHGVLSEDGIVEFVQDMMTPTVITLDESSFGLLERKSQKELWVVDFFAPWCGPCRRLANEWRKLAKQVVEFPEIKVAQVDCVANSDICSSQNIRSYPTIRFYPLGSKGLNTVGFYNGNRDVVSMKRWLLNLLPSPVTALTSQQFQEQILSIKFILPWLVDFYAPWCGHCTHFEPEFRKVANRLEGIVRTAKIDCESERIFCGKQYVNSYPSVYLYMSPSAKYEISSNVASEIISQVKQIINRRQPNHDEL